jgi:hypothetical protein
MDIAGPQSQANLPYVAVPGPSYAHTTEVATTSRRRSLSEDARPGAAVPMPESAIEVLDLQERDLTSRIVTLVGLRGNVRATRALLEKQLKPKKS